MHFDVVRQQGSQRECIGFRIGVALRTTWRSSAGDRACERMCGVAQQTDGIETGFDPAYGFGGDVGQQHALPWRHAHYAVAAVLREPRESAQRGRIDTSERGLRADMPEPARALLMGTESQARLGWRAPPCAHCPVVAVADRTGDVGMQAVQKRVDAAPCKRLTQTRLVRLGQVEECLDQSADERRDIDISYGTYGAALFGRGTACKAECKPGLGIFRGHRTEPDVVRVIEHRQPFAAVEQQSELRRKRREARRVLQHVQDFARQRSRIVRRIRVTAGAWIRHQIADIVGGCEPLAQCNVTSDIAVFPRLAELRAEARPQQSLDERGRFARTHATQLQVRPVREFDDARCVRFGGIRKGKCLIGAQFAARQLDATKPPVARVDDAGQGRTGGKPWGRGRSVTQGQGSVSVARPSGASEGRADGTGAPAKRYYAPFRDDYEAAAAWGANRIDRAAMKREEAVPWLTVVGIGEDGWAGLGRAARRALLDADIVIGGERHLAMLPRRIAAHREAWPRPFDVAPLLAFRGKAVCVLASGDPMLFGVGGTLSKLLDSSEWHVLPAPSSPALAAARLNWPLQEIEVVSLVGRPLAALNAHLRHGARIVVLSRDGESPAALAALLAERGFGATRMIVFERLGGPRETRLELRADEWQPCEVAALNLVALECRTGPNGRSLPLTIGLPDEAFANDGQLTKRDIRAMTLARLAPARGELLWDVGAGCGSIGIEWMRSHPSCRAIAIESHPQRQRFIVRNCEALGVPSLQLIEGSAPQALTGLPAPDAVFIGGGVTVPGVLEACWASLKRGGRLVANAVTLEGEAALVAWRARHGGALTRIALSEARPLGAFDTWRSALPITLLEVTKPLADAPAGGGHGIDERDGKSQGDTASRDDGDA